MKRSWRKTLLSLDELEIVPQRRRVGGRRKPQERRGASRTATASKDEKKGSKKGGGRLAIWLSEDGRGDSIRRGRDRITDPYGALPSPSKKKFTKRRRTRDFLCSQNLDSTYLLSPKRERVRADRV